MIDVWISNPTRLVGAKWINNLAALRCWIQADKRHTQKILEPACMLGLG
ncbi:hypothetical protein H4CHR_01347 [Variovorax sp. PBS-H4]|nr:hypothetical protein H4CHR_01347 [Variovorax sp. PBS-H4]